MDLQARLILVHKQSTSARTRFLRVGNNVVLPRALPGQSVLVEDGQNVEDSDVVCHPTVVMNTILQTLGLDCDDVVLETEFKGSVKTPDGLVPVYLARFTSIDPPQAQAEKIGGHFIAITEARDLAPIQLDMVRQVYTYIME